MLSVRIFRTIVLFSVCLTLAACGGGDGGGEATSGSANLALSTSSVEFTTYPNAPLPSAQSIDISWTNTNVAGVATGFPPEVTPASWLDLNIYGNSSPMNLTFSLNTTNLAAGTYTTTVRVITGDINSNILGLKDIDVTLTLTEKLVISSAQNIAFNMTTGGITPQPKTVNLTGNGIDWTASSNALWIQLSDLTGTAPGSVTVGVDPAGLATGTHNATVTFVDDVTTDTAVLSVTFNIEPNHLAINGNADLSFDIVKGAALPPAEAVELIGDGVEWTAVSSASWVDLSQQSGTAPSSLTLGLDPTGLLPGDYTATVDFFDDNSSEFVTVNVQLSIEGHKLYTHDNGIALASMPSISQLAHSIDVLDNDNSGTPWTAASDQLWLTVTPSGNTGDSLDMTADPTGLSVDTIHYASVTIDSSDPTIESPEIIRVGLWVGAADPNPSDTLALTYTEIASDPIRPLVYMNDGGTDIDVYNVHTSAFVRTISNIGAQLGDMEPSSDGSTLYVADLTNYALVPVNLDTDEIGTPVDLTTSTSLRLAYGRNQGKPLIFVGNSSVLDADDGSEFPVAFTAGYSSTLIPAVSQNGMKACALLENRSPYTIECYDVAYSEKNGGALTLTSLGDVRGPGGMAKDLALTPDGTRVYVASGSPYTFIGFDVDTMLQDQTLPADSYPNNVEIGSNNLLYGGISSLYGPTDLWVYSFTGIEQSSYYISGYADDILIRQLVVSGDGLRIILSAKDPKVVMMDSP